MKFNPINKLKKKKEKKRDRESNVKFVLDDYN